MRDVYIIGVGMIKFGKYLENDVRDLGGIVIKEALRDAGLKPTDIQSVASANSFWGYFSNQHSCRGQIISQAGGIDRAPVTNLENACMGGSHAMHNAWKDILTGLFDCTLAVGAEKLYLPADKEKQFGAFTSVVDQKLKNETFAGWDRLYGHLMEIPEGSQPKSHSVFMDVYGWMAAWHMTNYGTTQKQFAKIAAKNHNNGVLNPLAQYQFPMTVEEVMNDYVVSYPVTRSMCAPIGDGAAAAILCSAEYLKKLPIDTQKRAVRIRAQAMVSGIAPISLENQPMGTAPFSCAARATKLAYEMAGLGPEDVQIAEVHDASAVGELLQYENLQLCPVGEGGPFMDSGATLPTGKVPVNMSGGLISRGHPVGASGLAMLYELILQLRGEAEKRQIADVRIGIIENGGGLIGFDDGGVIITILEGKKR